MKVINVKLKLWVLINEIKLKKKKKKMQVSPNN